MKTLKTILSSVIMTSLMAGAAFADNYTVGQDMHNLNKASFYSTATLASFTGTTGDITGNANVDLKHLRKSTGEIKVNLASVDTGINKRNEHMRGVLNTDKNQFAIFKLKSIAKDIKSFPAYKTIIVPIVGEITINGVTKPLSTNVDLTYMPEQDKNYRAGNWIRLQSSFDVSLSDHGIKAPGIVPMKLNNLVKINIDVMGMQK
jgi:polyisoprenoid-binding protein YceI